MNDEYFDSSLLIGYSLSQRPAMQVVLSTGISRIWGSRVISSANDDCRIFCSDGSRESFKAVTGIPIELGLYSMGKSVFGLAFITHINFNPEEFFAGFTLNLMIGKRD